jgi:hypothetical protein
MLAGTPVLLSAEDGPGLIETVFQALAEGAPLDSGVVYPIVYSMLFGV